MKKLQLLVFFAFASFFIGVANDAKAQGIMDTWIGDTTAGYSGDGGPASLARLKAPYGVCFDGARNFYFTDMYNNVIRKVNATTGIITTVAGNATAGYSGDGGAATIAALSEPASMCCDAAGNLYFVDLLNKVIRKVSATTHIITTIAGNGTDGYSGDGGPATAAAFNYAGGICLDVSGANLYIADGLNNVIRKVVLSTGIITTFAGTGTAAYTGDGGAAATATLSEPTAVCFDPAGNMYIADHNNYVIRKIATGTNIITTVAGNGINGFAGDHGPATAATIGSIYGMCCDGHGDIYINDWSCSCRKISCTTCIITSQAGDGINSGYNGDGGIDTVEWVSGPVGCCVDPVNGNILIADLNNHSIRRATQPGFVSVLGTQSFSTETLLNVFPNPSCGRFTIQTSPMIKAGISLYNNAGVNVYTGNISGSLNTVDLSNQSPGSYFITIVSEEGIETKKIVIK